MQALRRKFPDWTFYETTDPADEPTAREIAGIERRKTAIMHARTAGLVKADLPVVLLAYRRFVDEIGLGRVDEYDRLFKKNLRRFG
jgi:hypothetical protein